MKCDVYSALLDTCECHGGNLLAHLLSRAATSVWHLAELTLVVKLSDQSFGWFVFFTIE